MRLGGSSPLQLSYDPEGWGVDYNGPYHAAALPMLAAWERRRPYADAGPLRRLREHQETHAKRLAQLHRFGGLIRAGDR